MTDEKIQDQTGNKDGLENDWLHQVVIRHAGKKDLSALEWEGEYARFRRIYAEVYKRMKRGLAVIWVAQLSSEIIGQVMVQLNTFGKKELANGNTRAYVHSFRVRPTYRGAGLGTLLMDTVEVDLARRGFKEITLNVSRQNETALKLYKQLGYQVIGEDPGVWSFHDENNVLQHVEEPGWRMLKGVG